jgi:LacI family transcriptional regulator
MTNAKKSRRPATMRDVAKLAGVSQPTVSRVLNHADTTISISNETRTKVLAAIDELSYRPNMLARSLRTQRTQMIAVLIADITNSFYPQIARAIQDEARQYNYDVLIANSDHLYENERHFCEAITRRPVDGVIMVPIHLTLDELDDFLIQTDTPISVLGQHIHHPNIDVVYVNDERAVYEATRWMIDEKGYREFGFVGVRHNLPPGPRRYRGFMRALDESCITINPDFMVTSDFTLEGGRQAARKFLQHGELPSALMVLNDLMAIGVIQTLQQAGYRVPEDVAVIGFDDIPEATIIRPALTTIAHDPVDIGRKLAQSLFERIENPDLPNRRLESTYRLIKRDST